MYTCGSSTILLIAAEQMCHIMLEKDFNFEVFSILDIIVFT